MRLIIYKLYLNLGNFIIRIFLLLMIIQVPGRDLIAQEVWSLERCIEYALENNIKIKIKELHAQYAKDDLLQTKLQILPSLNGYAGHHLNYGRNVDPFTYEFTNSNIQSSNFSLVSSVTLFNGFQQVNSISQSKYNFLTKLQEVEKTKNDVSLSITAAYLQILFNLESKENAKNQLDITLKQEEKTRKLLEIGSQTKGILLEIESQVASEELALVNAGYEVDMSYLTLVQILDLDSLEQFNIELLIASDINYEHIQSSVDELFQTALENLPQIKSEEYKLRSAQKACSIAQGGRSPRISVQATWWGSGYSNALNQFTNVDTNFVETYIGYTQSQENVYSLYPNVTYDESTKPFYNQFLDNRNSTFSVSLTLPVFNGWYVNNSIRKAKIEILLAEYQYQEIRNQLYKEIQQAHAEAVGTFFKYKATKKAVESKRESFNYIQQKFSLGMVDVIDLYSSKNQLIKAESDFLQSKYDLIFKTKILDFYLGKKMKL